MADRRVKMCPKENCEAHDKKEKRKSTDNYCSICSAPLVFVCAKCLREIEDKGADHRLCARCEELANERKEKIKNTAKDGIKTVGKGAVALGASVVVGIATTLKKDTQKAAIKKGVKIVKELAETAIKLKK